MITKESELNLNAVISQDPSKIVSLNYSLISYTVNVTYNMLKIQWGMKGHAARLVLFYQISHTARV